MTDRSHIYAKAFLQAIGRSHDEKTSRAFSRRFLGVLKKKRELYLLPKILRRIEKLLAKDTQTLVTSRFTLDARSREKLGAFLSKTFGDFHEKELVFEIDENTLGGVSVRHKDFLYDATLDSALAKLRAVWK